MLLVLAAPGIVHRNHPRGRQPCVKRPEPCATQSVPKSGPRLQNASLFTSAPQPPHTPQNPAAAGAPAPDISDDNEQVDDEYANMDEYDLRVAIVERKSLLRSLFPFLDTTRIGFQISAHAVIVYATCAYATMYSFV